MLTPAMILLGFLVALAVVEARTRRRSGPYRVLDHNDLSDGTAAPACPAEAGSDATTDRALADPASTDSIIITIDTRSNTRSNIPSDIRDEPDSPAMAQAVPSGPTGPGVPAGPASAALLAADGTDGSEVALTGPASVNTSLVAGTSLAARHADRGPAPVEPVTGAPTVPISRPSTPVQASPAVQDVPAAREAFTVGEALSAGEALSDQDIDPVTQPRLPHPRGPLSGPLARPVPPSRSVPPSRPVPPSRHLPPSRALPAAGIPRQPGALSGTHGAASTAGRPARTRRPVCPRPTLAPRRRPAGPPAAPVAGTEGS